MHMGSTETTQSGPTAGTPSTPAGSGSPTPSAPAGPSPSAPLLLGSASSAVKLAAAQHGQAVRGSVDVAPAGAGGTLRIELLAAHASLASAAAVRPTLVGRAARYSLPAGTVVFTVALDAEARHALRLRGRLPVRVQIALTAVHGSAVTVTRDVVLRR
jgi:hypothetical protein